MPSSTATKLHIHDVIRGLRISELELRCHEVCFSQKYNFCLWITGWKWLEILWHFLFKKRVGMLSTFGFRETEDKRFWPWTDDKLLQWNLSTMATLGTEESGRCREMAVMGRQGCNMTPVDEKLKKEVTRSQGMSCAWKLSERFRLLSSEVTWFLQRIPGQLEPKKYGIHPWHCKLRWSIRMPIPGCLLDTHL